MELSRIESGKVELEPVPLDLYAQMENMSTMFQQDMKTANLDFKVETDLIHSTVLCDDLKLTQVLMNLLSNAKKFTPAGGSVVCGVKQIEDDDEYGVYSFFVADTGIGMSEEFQKRAFEQFERERTSTVSGMQGSGLGLSIIKRIIDKMDGKYELQSKLGEGTKITITLRLKKTVASSYKADHSTNVNINFSGKKILLVEDNEFN